MTSFYIFTHHSTLFVHELWVSIQIRTHVDVGECFEERDSASALLAALKRAHEHAIGAPWYIGEEVGMELLHADEPIASISGRA